MDSLVTLIIILHNRHRNLDRLLNYYKNFKSPVIIADSSNEEHIFNEKTSFDYSYTPGLSYTQKISFVLSKVTTPYVVMCADDDFIIPSAINKCVTFLEKNDSYSVAQGNCINYKKESVGSKDQEFGLMYYIDSLDISDPGPYERVDRLFSRYRSLLYAVHRTEVLKLTFENAGEKIKNLYLNEYLTGVIPMLKGFYKELPILYQVREYAKDSDDKVTENIDTFFLDEKKKTQLNSFIDYLSDKAAVITNISKNDAYKKLYEIFEKFSKSEIIGNKIGSKISFKKRIGLIIEKFPIIGKKMIRMNRLIERRSELKKMIRTEEDKMHLLEISSVLERFGAH